MWHTLLDVTKNNYSYLDQFDSSSDQGHQLQRNWIIDYYCHKKQKHN